MQLYLLTIILKYYSSIKYHLVQTDYNSKFSPGYNNVTIYNVNESYTGVNWREMKYSESYTAIYKIEIKYYVTGRIPINYFFTYTRQSLKKYYLESLL